MGQADRRTAGGIFRGVGDEETLENVCASRCTRGGALMRKFVDGWVCRRFHEQDANYPTEKSIMSMLGAGVAVAIELRIGRRVVEGRSRSDADSRKLVMIRCERQLAKA